MDVMVVYVLFININIYITLYILYSFTIVGSLFSCPAPEPANIALIGSHLFLIYI